MVHRCGGKQVENSRIFLFPKVVSPSNGKLGSPAADDGWPGAGVPAIRGTDVRRRPPLPAPRSRRCLVRLGLPDRWRWSGGCWWADVRSWVEGIGKNGGDTEDFSCFQMCLGRDAFWGRMGGLGGRGGGKRGLLAKERLLFPSRGESGRVEHGNGGMNGSSGTPGPPDKATRNLSRHPS